MTIRTLTSYIDGAFISAGDQSTPVLNPANGTEIATAWHAPADALDRAVKAARRAFGASSTATLAKLAVILEERAKELAEVESAEAGKSITLTTEFDVPGTIDNVAFFSGAARNLEGKAAAEYSGSHTSMIRREPARSRRGTTRSRWPAGRSCPPSRQVTPSSSSRPS